MVVFIGYLYYTVPSGLCLYIIVSSAWGIAERKLLPKTQRKTTGLATAAAVHAKNTSGNGAAARRDRKKQRGR
jgi:YidC/Oxa1 family membrane protein insertase